MIENELKHFEPKLIVHYINKNFGKLNKGQLGRLNRIYRKLSDDPNYTLETAKEDFDAEVEEINNAGRI